MLAMPTMWPWPRSIISGSTASIDWATPTTLTSSVCRRVDVSSSGTSVSEPIPAHATRTSNGPSSAERRFTAANKAVSIGDVDHGAGDGAVALVLERLRKLGQRLRIAIDQTERHSLLDQGDGRGTADSVGGAGQEYGWFGIHRVALAMLGR